MAAKIIPLALVLGTAASVALAEPVVLTETMMDEVTAAGRTDVVADVSGVAGLGIGGAEETLGVRVQDLQDQDGGISDPGDPTVIQGNFSRQVRAVRRAGPGNASVHQQATQTSTTH